MREIQEFHNHSQIPTIPVLKEKKMYSNLNFECLIQIIKSICVHHSPI